MFTKAARLRPVISASSFCCRPALSRASRAR
uniref:Uncharacterized protein n=1 Tax=Siphoviridae sp. ctRlz6 TaxID=2823581 RepID=A0A8S5LDN9_9CAUD|nr:MAG TPA: hypothetical protein [Siphoviridae sp. ctRlz6]